MAFTFSQTPLTAGFGSSTVPTTAASSNMTSFASADSTARHSHETTEEHVPAYEQRQFIVETYPLFASLQRIVHEYEQTIPLESFPPPPPAAQVQYYARISSLYRSAMLNQLPAITQDSTLDSDAKTTYLQHYSTMHSILSLVELLYLPQDGLGDGVVGEELLDWLNVVDRAPSTEQGTELSSLAHPWDSPEFFPYLTKCLVRGHFASLSALLNLVITAHAVSPVRDLASLLVRLVELFPRSTQASTESELRHKLKTFKHEARSSLDRAEPLYSQLLSSSLSDLDQEEATDYVESFKQLFNLLTLSLSASLDPNSTLEQLSDQTDTWQETLIAYTLLIDPLTTRPDLPALLTRVLASQSIDSTLIEERVQDKLFRGDVTGLLHVLVDQDERQEWLWLATHVIDLLSHLNLAAFSDLPSIGSEQAELGPREQFLTNYADALLSQDETLWRVSCEYYGECGHVGMTRITNLLAPPQGAIKFAIVEDEQNAGNMDVERAQPTILAKDVEEVLTVLGEYGLEDQVRHVCRSYAGQLIEKKKYGTAIAYCVRANDAQKIDTIALEILNEYVNKGQEAFIRHVDSLPTSLLRPESSSTPGSPTSITRDVVVPKGSQYPSITFLSRYRDFLALYSLASQQQQQQQSTPEEPVLEEEDEQVSLGLKRQSAQLLILLLTSGMAPKSFWAVMLLDSVGLLESQPPVVTLSETYELLRVLEEVTGPIELSNSESDGPAVDIFGDLELLGKLIQGQTASSTTTGSKSDSSSGKSERTKVALEQLEVVRGALARHLAICCCL
ncbi:uncharacterized protein JCM15063_006090 [Sporobolomyces koalae]|uniref:uncharacterized protein n=1 Tax=Sporobolomyces koalae TaxID=500713 RepID=UPI00316DE0C4